jgi:tetratricopeptide (TPR) repeat protein
VPDELAQTIVAKAEGNPFFLEELTRAVIEHGSFQAEVIVPDTIQGVLSARIDRLPEVHKRLLQTASVLGREFSHAVLHAMWEGADSLEPLLSELKRLEFLFERSGAEEPIFVFRHALTQDVAYESLLTPRRQALHTAAGSALETLYPNGLTERSEELAYHFRLGGVWDKAFDYLTRSGDKARQAFANQEAIAFYTQAIEVSEKITSALDEEQLLPVYEGRGLVWFLLYKYDEAITDFQQMRQIAKALGNHQKEGEGLCHLAYVHWMKLREDQMPFVEQYSQEALALSRQTGNRNILAKSLTNLGLLHQTRGNLHEANRYMEESLQISRHERYIDSLTQNLLWLNTQAYWQGRFHRAVQLGQEIVTLSRDVYDGFSELFNLAFFCLEYGSLGEYAQAFCIVQEGITKAKARDNIFLIILP